jgi:hypothetical protein
MNAIVCEDLVAEDLATPLREYVVRQLNRRNREDQPTPIFNATITNGSPDLHLEYLALLGENSICYLCGEPGTAMDSGNCFNCGAPVISTRESFQRNLERTAHSLRAFWKTFDDYGRTIQRLIERARTLSLLRLEHDTGDTDTTRLCRVYPAVSDSNASTGNITARTNAAAWRSFAERYSLSTTWIHPVAVLFAGPECCAEFTRMLRSLNDTRRYLDAETAERARHEARLSWSVSDHGTAAIMRLFDDIPLIEDEVSTARERGPRELASILYGLLAARTGALPSVRPSGRCAVPPAWQNLTREVLSHELRTAVTTLWPTE